MRGSDRRSGELFSYVDVERRIRRDHPLRSIRGVVNEALDALSRQFAALYGSTGRPSIPPEMLLRAMLLQAFYSIRSERQLMERLEFDLLFRWFVGLSADEPAWDHWIKTIAGLRKTRFIGRAKTALAFTFAAAAYNLVRLPKLIAQSALAAA